MRSLIVSLILATAGLTASADEVNPDGGLFVEPGVTYQIYDSTIQWPAPFSNSTGKVQGWGVMGRFGLHVDSVFFVAVDARFSLPHFKDSSVNYDASATQWDLGPSVGVQMPWVVGLRLWATYVATSQLDPKSSGNFDVKMNDGKGYRVGAGFKLAIVSLNLEYQKVDYDNIKVQSAGPLSGQLNSKYAGEGWVLSASFPLAL
ncbi:MAG: outer membrane beta-barrel protein [Pseudobdellovibrionaceae bacterium]